MGRVKIDVDVNWLWKTWHCRVGRTTSSAGKRASFQVRPHLLLISAHHTTQALAIHDTRKDRATLTLNVGPSKCKTSGVMGSIVKAGPCLKRATNSPCSTYLLSSW